MTPPGISGSPDIVSPVSFEKGSKPRTPDTFITSLRPDKEEAFRVAKEAKMRILRFMQQLRSPGTVREKSLSAVPESPIDRIQAIRNRQETGSGNVRETTLIQGIREHISNLPEEARMTVEDRIRLMQKLFNERRERLEKAGRQLNLNAHGALDILSNSVGFRPPTSAHSTV